MSPWLTIFFSFADGARENITFTESGVVTAVTIKTTSYYIST